MKISSNERLFDDQTTLEGDDSLAQYNANTLVVYAHACSK